MPALVVDEVPAETARRIPRPTPRCRARRSARRRIAWSWLFEARLILSVSPMRGLPACRYFYHAQHAKSQKQSLFENMANCSSTRASHEIGEVFEFRRRWTTCAARFLRHFFSPKKANHDEEEARNYRSIGSSCRCPPSLTDGRLCGSFSSLVLLCRNSRICSFIVDLRPPFVCHRQ